MDLYVDLELLQQIQQKQPKELWRQLHTQIRLDLYAQKDNTALQVKMDHKTVIQAHITQILEEQAATIAQLDSYAKRVNYKNQRIVMLDIIAQLKRHQWLIKK